MMAILIRILLALAPLFSSMAATCTLQDLNPGNTVNGSLDATDCHLRDIVPTASTNTYADVYRLTLGKTTILTARLDSTVFNTMLMLYSSLGSKWAQSDNSASGADSRLVINLPAGTYNLIVTSRTVAAGGYQLTASAETPRDCPIRDLDLDTVVSGAFTNTGCRELDTRRGSTDERPLDRYRVKASRRSILKIDMDSLQFETSLEMYDSDLDFVTEDHGGAGGNHSRLYTSVGTGTYIVYAYPYTTASGGYTIKAATEALRKCVYQDLKNGSDAAGALAATSCRWLDIYTPSDDVSYVDLYRLKPGKRSVATIEMSSTAFDTYLALVSTDLEEWITYNNDISAANKDSRLLVSLEAGTYVILATSRDVATGSYALKAVVENPRTCPARELRTTDAITGSLSGTACRFLDLIAPSDDDSPVDVYRLAIAKAGLLHISAASKDFIPYLGITDTAFGYVYESFTYDAIDAEVLATAGNYYLLLSSLNNAGSYSLKTSYADAPACPDPTINPSDRKQGKLSADTCRLKDMMPWTDYEYQAERYNLTLTDWGLLVVSARSGAFAPVVLVGDTALSGFYAAGYNLTASTTQTGVALPAGRYSVLVTTYGGKTGAYDVTTSFLVHSRSGDTPRTPADAAGEEPTGTSAARAGRQAAADSAGGPTVVSVRPPKDVLEPIGPLPARRRGPRRWQAVPGPL